MSDWRRRSRHRVKSAPANATSEKTASTAAAASPGSLCRSFGGRHSRRGPTLRSPRWPSRQRAGVLCKSQDAPGGLAVGIVQPKLAKRMNPGARVEARSLGDRRHHGAGRLRACDERDLCGRELVDHQRAVGREDHLGSRFAGPAEHPHHLDDAGRVEPVFGLFDSLQTQVLHGREQAIDVVAEGSDGTAPGPHPKSRNPSRPR